jgi:hypothetical protein
MSNSVIDWGGAVVSDGTLSVPLTSSPSKAWKRRFRGVLEVLDRPSGDWGEIALRRGTITVRDVREGGEDRLRHLLDGVVVEVSGELDVTVSAADEKRDSLRARDRRMTEAFRRVAGEGA